MNNAERVAKVDDAFGFSVNEDEQTAPQGDVGNVVPDTTPEIDYQAELTRLQQRIGTDNDVNTVKSQRDQLRNQFEQVRQQAEADRAQMTQLQAQVQQYQAYLMQQMPPDQQAAYRQQQAQEVYQQQLYAAQEQARQYQQQLLQAQAQSAMQQLRDAMIRPYADTAQTVGIDPSDLDTSSFDALQKSYNEKVKPRLVPRQVPTPPQSPNRGAPSPTRTIDQLFNAALVSENPRAALERIFNAGNQGGVKIEDIINLNLK